MMQNLFLQVVLLITALDSRSLRGEKEPSKKQIRKYGKRPNLSRPMQERLCGTGNAVADMLRTNALLTQGENIDITSPIAAIGIPEIGPILNLINEAATEIYERISKGIFDSKIDIFQQIDGIFVDALPSIEGIVTGGNLSIRNVVNLSFINAVTNFKGIFDNVVTKELADATGNITGPNANILTQILEILNLTQEEINKNISGGLGTSISAVTDALKAANNAIYSQIEKLLADPTNMTSIASQLMYPNPATITAALVNTSSGIYEFITTSINDALLRIKTIIDAQAALSSLQQENTLNAANKTLFGSLTDEVNGALATIQGRIAEITDLQILEISGILTNIGPGVLDQLSTSLSGLEANISEIIRSVTETTVNKTTSMIQSNNSSILTSVVQILAAFVPLPN